MQPPVANQHTWAFTLLCPGNHPITAAILIEWVQVDPSPLYGANVSIIGSLADMRAEAGRGRVARFAPGRGALATGNGDAGRRQAERRGYVEPDEAEELAAAEQAAERARLGVAAPGDIGRLTARVRFHRDERARAALAAWRGRQRR
jgi:hypothetical protein